MTAQPKFTDRVRKVFRMAAGTQQTAALGDNNGNGNDPNNGSAGSGDNATGQGTGDNGSGASGDAGSNGGSNGDAGNANAGTGGSGQSGNDGGNGSGYGFDGTFDPERARNLINTLREESRGKDSVIRELRERLEKLEKGSGNNAGGSTDTDNKSGSNETDNAALEEIRKIRNELAEEKRLTRFQSLATGMHPDAVAMAYSNVKDEFDIDSNGVVTNMTSVIESLRQRQPFLFAPVTNGQNQGGSAGSGTNTAGGGKFYTEDEKASMRAFGMTPEQWEATKNGQPVK